MAYLFLDGIKNMSKQAVRAAVNAPTIYTQCASRPVKIDRAKAVINSTASGAQNMSTRLSTLGLKYRQDLCSPKR